MKHYMLLSGLLLVSRMMIAQTPQSIGRNSVRLGIDLTSLDAPDAVGPRYVGRLARHFGNDRFVIAAEAGYMRVTSATQPFNGVDPGSNRRERFTVDATAFVDLLPQLNHALRVGIGLSAWYRREDIYQGAAAIWGPASLQQAVTIDRLERNQLNTGVHFATEYEWLFTPRWGVDARFRLVNLEKAGFNSVLGAGVSHRF